MTFLILYYIFVTHLILSIVLSTNIPLSSRVGTRNVNFIPANIYGEKYKRPIGASKLMNPSVSPISSSSGAACKSDQVRITLGDDDGSIVVSYVSYNLTTKSEVKYSTDENDLISSSSSSSMTTTTSSIYTATGSSVSYSQLLYIVENLIDPTMGSPSQTAQYVINLENSSKWAYDKVTGEHWANYLLISGSTPNYGSGSYNNPYMYYDSPYIHTVTIKGLSAGTPYYYQPAGSCKIYRFVIPPRGTGTSRSYPFMVGLTCDIGQTAVSNASVNALISMEPDVVLIGGDLSYADGWTPLWDTFGRMIEPLASHIPLLTTGGNHEVQSEMWQSYSYRYPTPYSQSGSTNFCYWGKEVGVVNIIALCSYAGYYNTSNQYIWLENYFDTKINRTRTPWIIVMTHTPLYNSNTGHWMEGELLRIWVEPLLYRYGVDIVISGHVHSYERTYPVYNNEVNKCGITYLNLGDGGNYEGAYVPWRDPVTDWSAFREASFGVANLTFVSDTIAHFWWHRHACDNDTDVNYHMDFSDNCVTSGDNSDQAMLTSDMAQIIKPSSTTCPNRWQSSPNIVPETVTSAPTSTSNSDNDELTIQRQKTIIYCLLAVIVILIIATCVISYQLWKKLSVSSREYMFEADIENRQTSNGLPINTDPLLSDRFSETIQ